MAEFPRKGPHSNATQSDMLEAEDLVEENASLIRREEAAVRLQRWWRSILSLYEEVLSKVVVMQCCIRQFLARRRLQKLKDAKRGIQATDQSHEVQSEALREEVRQLRALLHSKEDEERKMLEQHKNMAELLLKAKNRKEELKIENMLLRSLLDQAREDEERRSTKRPCTDADESSVEFANTPKRACIGILHVDQKIATELPVESSHAIDEPGAHEMCREDIVPEESLTSSTRTVECVTSTTSTSASTTQESTDGHPHEPSPPNDAMPQWRFADEDEYGTAPAHIRFGKKIKVGGGVADSWTTEEGCLLWVSTVRNPRLLAYVYNEGRMRYKLIQVLMVDGLQCISRVQQEGDVIAIEATINDHAYCFIIHDFTETISNLIDLDKQFALRISRVGMAVQVGPTIELYRFLMPSFELEKIWTSDGTNHNIFRDAFSLSSDGILCFLAACKKLNDAVLYELDTTRGIEPVRVQKTWNGWMTSDATSTNVAIISHVRLALLKRDASGSLRRLRTENIKSLKRNKNDAWDSTSVRVCARSVHWLRADGSAWFHFDIDSGRILCKDFSNAVSSVLVMREGEELLVLYKDGKTEMVPIRSLMVACAGGENQEEAGEPKEKMSSKNKKKRSEKQKKPLY